MNIIKNLSLALAFTVAAAAAHAAPAAGRVIEITPQTRYINVTEGETVTLKSDGASHTWQVDTAPNASVFPLSQVAPAAAHGARVTVYVAANPLYQNG